MWVASVAASGKLKRNAIAGIRTSATIASDEAWLRAHQRTKTITMVAGVIMMLSGLGALFQQYMLGVIITILVGATIAVALITYSAVLGNRAAREASTKQ